MAYLGYAIAHGAQWPGDRDLMLALQSARSPLLDAVMIAVSYVGYFLPIFGPLVVVLFVTLWRLRGAEEALFVVVPTLVADAMSLLVKGLVQRPRPGGDDLWVYAPSLDFSYPSQHVVTYTVLFGAVGFLATRRWQGQSYRWPGLITAGLLILMVGPSRVYLASHWPSDVLGGYLLGYAVWALAVFILLSRSSARGPEQRGTEV